MHPMLNVAVNAAIGAAQIIHRASADLNRLTVSKKQHNDFVTEVDKASEAAIIDTLKGAYPDHAILAEESGRSGGKDGGSDFQWIIDPLDGTTNFIHGFPYYCVSIALAYKGEVVQAVVYDPNSNELFTATRGGGAFLNERPIRVGARDRLADGLIGTGFPFRETDDVETFTRLFVEMSGGLCRAASSGRLRARPCERCGRASRRLLRARRQRMGHGRREPAGHGGGRVCG